MAVVKLNVTLRQLRAFVAVNDHGSFSAAAEALAMTQGALSHLVTDLERQLGFKVLERTTRRLGLTPAGDRYLKQARRVLAEVNALSAIGHDILHDSRSRFSLGSTAALIASTLPPLLHDFSDHWAGRHIELKDYQPDELIDAVALGKLDLGFGPIRWELDAAVRAEKLFSSPLMVVLAHDHPLSHLKAMPWDLLCEQTLVLQNKRSIPQLERNSGSDFSHTRIIELSQLHSILSVVESADGVTIVAEYALKYLSVHNVVAMPIIQPEVAMEVGLFRKNGHELPEAAQTFAAFVREHYLGGSRT